MTPLWREWPRIQRRVVSARHLALFLDYDGTLVPITSHPAQARAPDSVKRLLSELAGQPGIWLALISGRSLKDLKRLVGLPQICYVGNHGLELQGPQLRYINPVARMARPILKRLFQELARVLRPIQGLWVEDKGYTLSVHYRLVRDSDWVLVKNGFYEVVRPYVERRQVRVTEGKLVFEIRPAVRWDKGRVVQWLWVRQKVVTRGKILPIYAGDDQTDEDAFLALQEGGITVAVGPSSPLSRARYHLSSSQEVRLFLSRLLGVWKAKPRSRP